MRSRAEPERRLAEAAVAAGRGSSRVRWHLGRGVVGVLLAVAAAGCLGAVDVTRSYFVLHGEPIREVKAKFPGTVRVRRLAAESVYEKFQLVVRRSPYELKYSDLNVWAVRPNQMVTDIVARLLEQTGLFEGVSTELGEVRPRFTLDGGLYSLEVYDSDDVWFAHLSMSLELNVFATGRRLWVFNFDRRKEVESGNYSHAVRAMSELLTEAVTEALAELEPLAAEVERDPELLTAPGPGPKAEPKEPEPSPPADAPAPGPVYVPEHAAPGPADPKPE